MRFWLVSLLVFLLAAVGSAQSLSSVSLSPTTVVGGANSTGTVTLSAAAPSAGTTVTLSSDSAFAVVPKSVKVLAAAKTATFTVTTLAVATNGVGTVSATLGSVTKTAKLAVNAPNLTGLTLNPTAVMGGTPSTGTVTISSAAPTGGFPISLSSNSASATVLATVVVPAKATTATFSVQTSAVTPGIVATISASTPNVTKTAKLTINQPALKSFTISPASVIEGLPATGQITLTGPAPSFGLAMTITPGAPYVHVPASIMIPPGQSSWSFEISTSIVSATSATSVSVKLLSTGQAIKATVTVAIPAGPSMTLVPPAIAGGVATVGVVTLASAAPAGGRTVALTSNNFYAFVPATVTVPQGAKSAQFTVRSLAAVPAGSFPVYPGSNITAVGIGSATLSLVASGCQPGAAWPMLGGNPNHTSVGIGIPNSGVVKWASATGNSITGSPVIGSDGTIYIGSYDHTLHAYYSNGEQKWASAPAGSDIASTPAIGPDGTIYFTSLDGNLYALNPDGSNKWTCATYGNAAIYSSPAFGPSPVEGAPPSYIYFGAQDGKLYAVGASSGKIAWIYQTNGPVQSSPAVGPDGSVYFGSGDQNVYALTANGSFEWSYTTGSTVIASPTLGPDGTVYVGSDDSREYALTPTGGVKWQYETKGGVESTAAIGADGTIYFGSKDGRLYAVSPAGKLVWTFATGYAVTSSPAIAGDGTIVVGSVDWNIYAVTPSGLPKWAVLTGGAVASSPAIDLDGTIYVGSEDNNLYAIGTSSPWAMLQGNSRHTGRGEGVPANNTQKWTSLSGAGVGAPVVGTDGTIYSSGFGGTGIYPLLYAVSPSNGSIEWAFPVGSFVTSEAVGPDGAIYVAAGGDSFYALNPNGSLKWWRSGAYGPPTFGAAGTIYASFGNGSTVGMVALNSADGSLQWSKTLGDPTFNSAPGIGADGTIYIGSSGGYLYALNPANGAELWRYQTGNAIISSPTIGIDGTIYFGSEDAYVYAITPAGKLLWRYKTQGQVYSSPAIGLGGLDVYVGSADDNMYALNAQTGKLVWSFQTGNQIPCSPVIGSDGTVYVGSVDGYLYAIDPSAQSVVWKLNTSHPIETPMAMGASGTIYITNGAGLSAIGTQ